MSIMNIKKMSSNISNNILEEFLVNFAFNDKYFSIGNLSEYYAIIVNKDNIYYDQLKNHIMSDNKHETKKDYDCLIIGYIDIFSYKEFISVENLILRIEKNYKIIIDIYEILKEKYERDIPIFQLEILDETDIIAWKYLMNKYHHINNKNDLYKLEKIVKKYGGIWKKLVENI